jgi:ribosomal protein S12 methylthiotransferase accessory factor
MAVPAAVPAPASLGNEVDAGFAEAAAAAGALCGVTRLADITRLDRIGLPVWQAVRPAGRGLSVHQGKGASAAAARLGALCEAIESHCAEFAPEDGPVADFVELPERERAAELADYCWRRSEARHARGPVQWSAAQDLLSGCTFFLPHALVSLDYTRGLPSPFDRSSTGLGAGPDSDSAIRTALLEVVERDAFGEWRQRPLPERLEAGVALDSIRLPWFLHWRERLAQRGLSTIVFACPSIPHVPVLACAIVGRGEYDGEERAFYGTAADPDPELALFKALTEALQSRLTRIAAVRDDILPRDYSPRAAFHSNRGRDARLDWQSILPAGGGIARLIRDLEAAGYPIVAVKRLSGHVEGVTVAKVFVPGLGSLTRERRIR